jgi:hypothetical protein
VNPRRTACSPESAAVSGSRALLADVGHTLTDHGVEGFRRSIADVTDAGSLAEVHVFKRESKAAARATGLRPGSVTQWVTDSLIPGRNSLIAGVGDSLIAGRRRRGWSG